ncbi:hypothetical protein PB2503_01192 [Parvularcula bermudensis HTCC2503]|uniref:DUF3616 domain-containing protein n=1 Tax=Parvularcula bermudensis (strain ATCC BAA-594 / HTCC2503 / KCTC 12087) TaxID=314260 RepID=E0TBB4_PARBH|nr:DUF3616 domain-containing protein [Parvularcula bermudensis]ADM08318.1 hypothetical protein PB2503_01192 [Parvularcula bermudensis HTCC2503]
MIFDPLILGGRTGTPSVATAGSMIRIGQTLFLAPALGAFVDRLVLSPGGDRFHRHKRYDLSTVFSFPSVTGKGVRLAGLSIADGYLWVCATQSLRRPSGEDGDTPLTDLHWCADEAFFGRVPLLEREKGVFEVVGAVAPFGFPLRQAASIPMEEGRDVIRQRLASHPLLTPFAGLPEGDNGLAVGGVMMEPSSSSVIFALKGPVIDGKAILVRWPIAEKAEGRLKFPKEGERHPDILTCDLGGGGIHAMSFLRDRLYFLSGPVVSGPLGRDIWSCRWSPTANAPSPTDFRHHHSLADHGGPRRACGLAAEMPLPDRIRLLISYGATLPLADNAHEISVEAVELPLP